MVYKFSINMMRRYREQARAGRSAARATTQGTEVSEGPNLSSPLSYVVNFEKEKDRTGNGSCSWAGSFLFLPMYPMYRVVTTCNIWDFYSSFSSHPRRAFPAGE
jgi:hypothetical protein